ncbi:PiggyBac transposable element-derived protein 4 [Labeo rohita]|uniref:PiggyBac transposable element-derived protein 4 n=1 Tax=Labeo rohita TaxID=84645 RepID=A0ABQ8L3H2_LABRO|nr:PiggyBac transposable element-derived protein 4 [Labeo rohita]
MSRDVLQQEIRSNSEVVDELCKTSDEEQGGDTDEEPELLFSEVDASDWHSDDTFDEEASSEASSSAAASKDRGRGRERGRSSDRWRGRRRSSEGLRGRGKNSDGVRGRGRGRERGRSSDRGRGRRRSSEGLGRRGRSRNSGRGREISNGRGRSTGQGRGRQEGRFSSGSAGRWHTPEEADIPPPETKFRPARTPGPQVIQTDSYSPLELFQLFFSTSVCETIIQNSNTYAAGHVETARRLRQDMSLKDFFSFLSITLYMGVVKLPAVTDYWKGSRLYGLRFPSSVMSCRKFLAISSALHLSDPKVDAENEKKKGTPAFDRLCKLKPLYNQIREGCKSFYQPHQNIVIDERMVASKARISLKQYMKDKPTKWHYKLFVLPDSQNAYTWDFFIYEGKSPVAQNPQNKGLSYESVMALVDEKVLGSGYKLYVDNFYTSPLLFRELLKKNIWACGTIRSNRVGFPQTTLNRLPKNAPRGSIRWKRDNQLLFIEWKDTREVLMCSSLHSANGGQTVQRRVKTGDGQWTTMTIPIPTVVSDYNKSMGGVDTSDALIELYSAARKTRKCCQRIHNPPAAGCNAKQEGKEFREALIQEFADWMPPPAPPASHNSAGHTPKHITPSSKYRRRCKMCHQKTPVICCGCDLPLCFLPKRDCFSGWHCGESA